ncbi:uncharacterized protein LOC130700184 [Daphnia carinata]|uniref:uncharacterized protein LOC130700184 n=1 Tax=Daphnia carinata TaxID=120202 RepID=UPI00257C708C|nr:uncharacterized protein LOC130700184 [Daphnia carinata]
MMVKQGFPLLFFISVAMTMEIPAMQCERDSDCQDAGESSYCLFSMCETCIPCEQMFNRRPPLTASGRPGCAKMEVDCGVCLPGYQSEDLTGQRYSIKCYPVTTEREYQEPVDVLSGSPETSTGAILILIVISTIIFVTGSCFVYSKRHRTVTTDSTNGNTQDENRKLVDRLPPPYEEPEEVCGIARTSEQIHTVVIVESDIPNQATPINHYHRPLRMDPSDMDEENEILSGPERLESQPVSHDGNESTETIPSLWEPNSTLDLRIDASELTSRMETQNGLVRSQSLELIARHPASHRPLTLSRSDPMLPTQSRRRHSSGSESYAHRHVRLSMHRLPVAPVASLANENVPVDTSASLPSCSGSTDQCQEDCEPNEPQAFLFDDSQISNSGISYENGLHSSILSFTGSLFGHQISSSTPTSSETGRGSQDSGFFDRSRRRPADDEFSFGVALFVKRPREFE